MLSDHSIIFSLDEMKKLADINKDSFLLYLYEQPVPKIKSQLEKFAYSSSIDYMSLPQMKKKRKQLEKDFYSSDPVAGAIGGAIGATIGGVGASKLSKLTKRKSFNKMKVPAAIVGGVVGAMMGQSHSQKNIIRDMKRIDYRLNQTKSSYIKKMKL